MIKSISMGRVILPALFLGVVACSQEADVLEAPVTEQKEAPEHERLLPLQGGRNFRDLGGYETADGRTVAWGKVYRSGTLTGLTDADYAYLEDRHIETIVDFRSSPERQKEPTDWRAGDPEILSWNYELELDVEAMMKVVLDPETTTADIDAMMADMYPDLLESQKEHYRVFFDRLAAGASPLLFHCSAGKDRTGVAAALFLTALGVDREQVISDYELSNQYIQLDDVQHAMSDTDSPIGASAAPELSASMAQKMASVRGAWLEATFAKMESESGSVLNYMRQQLDVSDGELEALRATYLEP